MTTCWRCGGVITTGGCACSQSTGTYHQQKKAEPKMPDAARLIYAINELDWGTYTDVRDWLRRVAGEER